MAPRLKVFTWADGFHAFTVAATSRPKALAAWGSGQDLFATGLARELESGPDFEAALASPGEVVQRGLAIDIDKISKAPKAKPSRGPSKAKRDKIARLKQALEAADVDHRATVRDLNDRRAALEAQLKAADAAYEARRSKLLKSLEAARG